jgi:hypothetical protein
LYSLRAVTPSSLINDTVTIAVTTTTTATTTNTITTASIIFFGTTSVLGCIATHGGGQGRAVYMEIESPSDGFTCEACGKSLHNPSNLRRHKFLHTGQRPFPCMECKNWFRSEEDRDNHQLTHKHMCRVCGAEFVFRPSVKRHMLDVHGILDGRRCRRHRSPSSEDREARADFDAAPPLAKNEIADCSQGDTNWSNTLLDDAISPYSNCLRRVSEHFHSPKVQCRVRGVDCSMCSTLIHLSRGWRCAQSSFC